MAAVRSNRLLLVGGSVLVVGVVSVVLLLQSGTGRSQTADRDPTAAGTATPRPAPSPTPGPIVRIQQPLEVPADHEAVAVQMEFIRGLAAVPVPGDRLNVYVLPRSAEEIADEVSEQQPDPNGSGVAVEPLPAEASLSFSAVEVLGIVGPLPQSAGGSPVMLLALPAEDAGRFMPLASTGKLWMTLLPSVDGPEDAA